MEWPDVTYDRTGNILMSRLMGADVRLDPAGFGIGFKASWEQALADVIAAAGKRYAIPPAPRTIHSAATDLPAGRWRSRSRSGSGCLLRHDRRVLRHGLHAGRDDRGVRRPGGRGCRPRRVVGVDGSATPAETRDQVAWIARRTGAAIGLGRDLRDDEIILDDRYHAGVYGIPDEATLEVMRLAARLEGMITDPVYEGKSMAGLVDMVVRGEIAKDSNVLYAHLGGQPALNAYASLFTNG